MSHSLRTIKLRPRAVQLAAITPVTAAALIFSVAASSSGPASADTGPTTSLLGVKVLSATNGYGPYEVNQSNGGRAARDGRPLSINGQKFVQGLGTHANSKLVYNLAGEYSTFSTWIGVDDEVGRKGEVRFLLQRDGQTVYTSPVMTGRDAARQVSVSVTGAKTLSLVVEPVGAISFDHADWGDPRVGKPSTPSTTPVDDVVEHHLDHAVLDLDEHHVDEHHLDKLVDQHHVDELHDDGSVELDQHHHDQHAQHDDHEQRPGNDLPVGRHHRCSRRDRVEGLWLDHDLDSGCRRHRPGHHGQREDHGLQRDLQEQPRHGHHLQRGRRV